MASRHGEEARRDVGAKEWEGRPVGIPHEQLIATQDRHDVADHDRPGAGERVACEAGGVFLDDRLVSAAAPGTSVTSPSGSIGGRTAARSGVEDG